MTDEMTCRICGGELASSRHSTRDIHQSLGTCIKTLRTRAEAAEDERDELKNRIGGLDEQVKIQCSDGNWNYDPYMHGMANGLLVAQATMHDLHDFTGLSAPDKWLDSRENAQTARAEAAEAELEQLAWRPMSETPKRIGTYVVAMMNAGGDGFYYDSICWLPWEKYKDAAQSDESRRAFTGDCEWFYFEEEWPPIHASHMDYLCWMEPDETGVEEMIWRMEEQGEGHDDENK